MESKYLISVADEVSLGEVVPFYFVHIFQVTNIGFDSTIERSIEIYADSHAHSSLSLLKMIGHFCFKLLRVIYLFI